MKAKILACVEVCAVFVLMVALFHGAQSTPLAGAITRAAGGRPLPGYALLLAASLAFFLLRARPRPRMPSLPQLKYQLDITARGFFPVLILSTALSRIDWARWPGALLVSAIAVGMLIWFARWAGRKPIREGTPADRPALLLLALPLFTRIAGVLAAVVYFYGLVALSEELLFRGYIQTRLNSVMGRPFHLFSIPWGWGAVISSILFGLWHLGWGSGAIGWPHVLWTMAAGLIFGLAREKSEGILAPTILHGIMNYGPQAALFDLFA